MEYNKSVAHFLFSFNCFKVYYDSYGSLDTLTHSKLILQLLLLSVLYRFRFRFYGVITNNQIKFKEEMSEGNILFLNKKFEQKTKWKKKFVIDYFSFRKNDRI